MFRIVNTRSGVDLGVFPGASEAEALDRFAREAGYASYADIPEEVRSRQDEILVLPVRYQLFVEGDQFEDWIDASGPEEALRVLRDAVQRRDHDDAAKPRRLCIEVRNEAGHQVAIDWVVIGSEARS